MTLHEEEKDMSAVLEKEYRELKEKYSKVRERIELLRVDEEGGIKLDRTNPDHREWFEDDE